MDVITLSLAKNHTKKEIAKLGTIQVLRGRLATYAELLAIPNPEPGDVYIIGTAEEENNEYIYVGDEWEKLGPIFDSGDVASKEYVNEQIEKLSRVLGGSYIIAAPKLTVDLINEAIATYGKSIDWEKLVLINGNGEAVLTYKNTSRRGTEIKYTYSKFPIEINFLSDNSVSKISKQPRDFIITVDETSGQATGISSSTTSSANELKVLRTDYDYSNPYTPLYSGSPATKKYVDDAVAGAGSLPVIAATDETNPVNLSDYAENGTAYIVKGHFFTPNTRNSMLREWADWFLLINADAPNGDVYQTLRPFSTVFLNGDYVLNSKIAFKLASEDDWKTRDIFTGEYDDPTAFGGFSPAGAYTMYNDITNQMNTYVINPSDEAYTTFFTEGEEEFNFINEEIGNDFSVQLAGVLQTIYDKYTSNEYGILLYLDNQPVWFKATDLWDEPESLTLANTYIYNGENGPIIKEVGLLITLVWEDGYITQIGVETRHNYIKVASEDLLNEKLGDIDTIVTQIVESILDAEGKEY